MSNPLYDAIFDVARVLEVPVVVAALISLAAVVVELGRFAVELSTRVRRRPGPARTRELERTALAARDDPDATARLSAVAYSADMQRSYDAILGHLAADRVDPADAVDPDNAVAKDLADFDLACDRRLARTRLLVRVGPALGLMGTLIPLAPALDGLANGHTQALTDNLRVAFSVTVLGLLVGAVAFALSLARESMYGQDYSDLEYVAAILTAPTSSSGPSAPSVGRDGSAGGAT